MTGNADSGTRAEGRTPAAERKGTIWVRTAIQAVVVGAAFTAPRSHPMELWSLTPRRIQWLVDSPRIKTVRRRSEPDNELFDTQSSGNHLRASLRSL